VKAFKGKDAVRSIDMANHQQVLLFFQNDS